MSNNICDVCQTENEPQYKYCKNCGHILTVTENTEQGGNNQNTNTYSNALRSYMVDFDGVTAEEMSIFIGKNGDKILPKFERLQLSKSKVSWTWPAAILGFLIGPMGAAIWFFYRKMYKAAVILAVIGAFFTVVTGAMNFGTGEIVPEGAVDAFVTGDFESAIDEITAANGNVSLTQQILGSIAVLIEDTVSVASGLFAGLFGMYIYKKYCTEKITQYRLSDHNNSFYKVGLAYAGGTSGGMLAVGIILIFAVQSIMEFITAILGFIF